MKTDSLFYLLFQTAPAIFFELIGQPAIAASGYRFSSVELKQTAFRLDGVFWPPEEAADQPLYFVEVQFQKDERLYRRLFAEVFLFLQQHPEVTRWQAVVIYARASLEPTDQATYGSLLGSGQCQRVYLDALVGAESWTLGVGLVRLVVEPPHQAARLARSLLEQAQTEPRSPLSPEQILELIETIVVYKFPTLSREEIAAMLGITELRQTRVFQEFYEEGLQQGQQQGLQEGLQAGRQEEGLVLILRQLRRRLGELPTELRAAMAELSVAQLEELGEALLDFEGLPDLEDWLAQLSQLREQVLTDLGQQLGPEPWPPELIAEVNALSFDQLASLMEVAVGWTDRAELLAWLEAQLAAEPELDIDDIR